MTYYCSLNSINKTLYPIFPVTVLLACLAFAGMSWVQAGGADLYSVFPGEGWSPNLNKPGDRLTIAPIDAKACSVSERLKSSDRAPACSADSGASWLPDQPVEKSASQGDPFTVDSLVATDAGFEPKMDHFN